MLWWLPSTSALSPSCSLQGKQQGRFCSDGEISEMGETLEWCDLIPLDPLGGRKPHRHTPLLCNQDFLNVTLHSPQLSYFILWNSWMHNPNDLFQCFMGCCINPSTGTRLSFKNKDWHVFCWQNYTVAVLTLLLQNDDPLKAKYWHLWPSKHSYVFKVLHKKFSCSISWF